MHKFMSAFVVFVFLGCIPMLALAEKPLSINDPRDEPFKFVHVVILSLQMCQSANERLKSSKEQNIISLMKNFIVFTSEIRQANLMVSPYISSKNKIIKKSANTFSTIYSGIVAINDRTLTFWEETLNDPGKAAAKQGTWMRKLSENEAMLDELWRMLPMATALTAHSLVDRNRTTEAGILSFLNITKAQLNLLKSLLRTTFGEKVQEEPKGGMLPVDVSARLLWQFLAQPYYTSDTKL